MKHVEYDPRVIRDFADALYRQAQSIVVGYTLLGGLIAGAVAWLRFEQAGGWVGFLLGAGLGWVFGQPRAQQLRLQAQTALLQVRIEENTRLRPAQSDAVVAPTAIEVVVPDPHE